MTLFNPVNIQKITKTNSTKSKAFPPELSFEKAITTILQEIDNIELGQSEYVLQQIHFPKGQCPLRNLLVKFKRSAEYSTMRAILEISEQDFGKRFREFVEEQLLEVMGETE